MSQIIEINTTENLLQGQWDASSLNVPTEQPDIIVVNESGNSQSKTC
jgi:hypothetical protein